MGDRPSNGRMHELVVNLHMHTVYSDGTGRHRDIADAALETGVDVVIVTDHNVLVRGPEGYYGDGARRVLLLIGEEIHDPKRLPQKSHLLAIGAGRELAHLAEDPQALLNAVRDEGGLTFLAHPYEAAAPAINETAITWEDWQVVGFTGLELWNGFSEIKTLIKSRLHAIFYVFFPQLIGHGPPRATLAKWDELTAGGRQVVAVGGSDAHALHSRLGPLSRTVFPYAFHFRAVNTHVFLPAALGGDLEADRTAVYAALAAGHAFVGYDLPASTRGFRFTAQTRSGEAWMGDEVRAEGGVTLQIRLPQNGDIRLIRDGRAFKRWRNRQTAAYAVTEPGVFRVEVSRYYLGRMRGWIYSNPIYVR